MSHHKHTANTDGVLDKKYALERKRAAHLSFRYKLRALASVKLIQRYKNDEKSFVLLDLGAAEGLTLLEMAERLGKGRYIGVEYDQSLLEEASRFPANIELKQGDACDLSSIEASTFDTVTALALVEHLQEPTKLFNEAMRVLKPGGLMIISAPSPTWDAIADRVGPANAFGGDHHFTHVTVPIVKKMAKEAGFEFLKYQRFMFAPIGLLPYFKITPSINIAWRIDVAVEKIKLFNWLFANQLFVLRKPHSF